MKHPEVLVRFRDTMRLRALRQLNRGKFEVVSLCCSLPFKSPDPTRLSKFRLPCFDIKYRTGMSLSFIQQIRPLRRPSDAFSI